VEETAGAEITAFYGENYEKKARLGERFGGRVYHDQNEFLDHRPLDLVLIGSPSGLHAEQGIAAAQRGVHVLVEKPLDINTQRANALIDQCKQSQVSSRYFSGPDSLSLADCFSSSCRLSGGMVLGRPAQNEVMGIQRNCMRPPLVAELVPVPFK